MLFCDVVKQQILKIKAALLGLNRFLLPLRTQVKILVVKASKQLVTEIVL